MIGVPPSGTSAHGDLDDAETIRLSPNASPLALRDAPALVRGLFTGVERWGWEFAPLPEFTAAPEPPPKWREPDEVALAWQVRRRRLWQLPWLASGVGAVALAGWALPIPSAVAVDAALAGWLVVGLATVLVRQVLVPRSLLRAAGQDRDFRFEQFRHRIGAWRAGVAAREEAMRGRGLAKEWLPLRLTASTDRVEVFGGTGAGWASLVTTAGSSLLRAGGSVLVVDLSERRVAGELAAFAAVVGQPVADLSLTRDDGTLLRGLDPDDAAEVVAGAVATMRSADAVDLRVVDAAVLGAVTGCLDGPITFTRLAAGLRVVRGHYDPEVPLSRAEVRRLTDRIDAVGGTDRVADAMHTLTGLVDLLAGAEPAGDPVPWSGPGLTVLATGGTHPRRKDFLDRVLVERVLHALRTRPDTAERPVVFLAGADRVGVAGVEALIRQSRRSGVRLVLMMERLRDDLTRLLGGAGSTTILMRLGNHEEAKAAAEFIGREHTFRVSQITRQVGESFTEGRAETSGAQTSSSTNSGRHRSRPADAKWFDVKAGSGGTSEGVAVSRADTWQQTVNHSVATSESTGTTESRVYEFTVEPVEVQSLPQTAFILVEHGDQGRRVLLADCNPGIALLPRVIGGPPADVGRRRG